MISFSRASKSSRPPKKSRYGYHVVANQVEECKQHPSRCPIDEYDHKETWDLAQMHLRNITYKRELAEKIAEFEAIEKNFHHPQRYQTLFFEDVGQKSVRKFGETMEQYVSQRGAIPSHIHSTMFFDLKYLPTITLRIEIKSKPVIDTEDGEVTQQWTAQAMEYKQIVSFREDKRKVFKTVPLDFTNLKATKKSLENLEALFRHVCERSGQWYRRGEDDLDYSNHVQKWLDRTMDMVNAIEGTVRMHEFSQLAQGDFRRCDFAGNERTVVVDVDYRRSTFSAQVFKDFVRGNVDYQGEIIDADIRVTHLHGQGDPNMPSWTLVYKNGSWRFSSTCWDERVLGIEVYTDEEIRSNIYWHMMNEEMTRDQNEALKVARYGADLFTMVESELKRHNG